MRIRPLLASTFRSDGGSMFGLVPKPIWEKSIAADERNRIPQNANAILIETDDGKTGLIDTGCGSPHAMPEKQRDINGLGPTWPLIVNLQQLSIAPSELDFVVLSHLHWDHAGGTVQYGSDNTSGLTFPNAKHYVHELEWEDATSRNILLHKSYPKALINALDAHLEDRLHCVQGDDVTILPGIRMVRSGGHTRGHSTVVLEHAVEILEEGESTYSAPYAVFCGDICPTQHHLRLVFQTAYDTYPLDTRRWKLEWLPKMADEGALLLFDHDPEAYGAFLSRDNGGEPTIQKTFPVATNSIANTRSE